MDLVTIITIIAGAITAIGGFIGGRKMAASSALAVAHQTVGLLESQMQVMQARENEKEDRIRSLISRVEVLEGMVLQREDLSQLKTDVHKIMEKLDA